MAEEKKLWPGWPDAGMSLDVENHEYADVTAAMVKVDRRLEEIQTTWERIFWLERFLIEFKERRLRAIGREHRERAAQGLPKNPDYIQAENSRYFAANSFLYGIERRLKNQKSIREIEQKEEEERRVQTERAKKEDEDRLWLAALARQSGEGAVDPDPAKKIAVAPEAPEQIASKELGQVKALTAVQRVWLFRFLLGEAGLDEDKLHKTEVARAIVAATSSDPSNIYEHVRKLEEKDDKEIYRDLTAVKSWFEKLKMTEMAKKVEHERKNYEG